VPDEKVRAGAADSGGRAGDEDDWLGHGIQGSGSLADRDAIDSGL
jgi:hypothetical protein